MKKLRRFVLTPNVTRLTDFEQMNIVGGDDAPTTGCAGLSQAQCSGTCYIDGHEGSCGWTAVPEPGSCTCAVVYVEL